jgi:hypothetical protein
MPSTLDANGHNTAPQLCCLLKANSINFINAIGNTPDFSYHKVHESGTLNLQSR